MKSLTRKVQNMQRNLDDNVEAAVEGGAAQTATEARTNVIGHNTVWRGHLFNSIYVTSVDGPGISRTVIRAETPYAAFVEYGTGARGDASAPSKFTFDSPSYTSGLRGAIINWVMTKPGFYGTRSVGTGEKIAQTIAEKGTYAHPYFRPAWFTTKPMVIDNAERAVRHTVRRS